MTTKLMGLLTPGNYQSSLNANIAAGATKNFTEIYLVFSNDCTDTEEDVLATDGLPALRETSRLAQVRSRSAVLVSGSDFIWEVTVEYDSATLTVEQSGGTEPQKPDRRRPIWSWSVETQEVQSDDVIEVVEYDTEADWPLEFRPAGKLVNSAGQVIKLSTPQTNPILTISRYQASLDPDVITFFVNRVNSEPFWGAPKGTARMMSITDHEEAIDGGRWRLVTYVIKFKMVSVDPIEPEEPDAEPDPNNQEYMEDTWEEVIANLGTQYIDLVDPGDPFSAWTLSPVSKLGYSSAIGLDYDGTAIDPTAGPDALKYLHVRMLSYVDFNILQLGPWGYDPPE